ncbi:MAG: selenoneine synthase SenA [Hydrogenophaga sp.]
MDICEWSAQWKTAEDARCGGREALSAALSGARQRTLALFAAYESALGAGLRVPHSPELNLPLWELGHIGWFNDWWIARNPERLRGLRADPFQARLPSRNGQADALYNSSEVAHATRWALALPDAEAVRNELQASLNHTLDLLSDTPKNDAALYFFRLALFHEDMHTEAAIYMAQTLGFTPFGQGGEPTPWPPTREATSLQLPAMEWALGRSGEGFSFDNELAEHRVQTAAVHIDSAPVSWAAYLPFVENGAADRRAFWSDAGWTWRQAQAGSAPRYLRRSAEGWEAQRWGQWQPLRLTDSACHLTAFEAEAWCRWAGRRLPTEAEWEAAAHLVPGFEWGSVWEWTSSAFAPFPGFEAHPYRDYSAPWFDGRPVLKGASTATAPRMRHPRYRNFFTRDRNDIIAGFRSVADAVHT